MTAAIIPFPKERVSPAPASSRHSGNPPVTDSGGGTERPLLDRAGDTLPFPDMPVPGSREAKCGMCDRPATVDFVFGLRCSPCAFLLVDESRGGDPFLVSDTWHEMEGLAMGETLSASERWGRHYFRCATCEVGATPDEDLLCPEGARLRRLSVRDAVGGDETTPRRGQAAWSPLNGEEEA